MTETKQVLKKAVCAFLSLGMPARVVYGCTNNSTTIGTTYYYKVKAVKVVNGENISSAYINTVSVTAK